MILDAEHIGKNIRDIRKAAKESQEKFAEQIDTSARTVSNIENGDVVPSLQTVANISENYNRSIDSIILKDKKTMNCTYKLNETTVYDEEGNAHIVYGVDVVDDHENIIESITDVFFERTKAEKVVKMCNKYNLALIHLRDVLEDIIDE